MSYLVNTKTRGKLKTTVRNPSGTDSTHIWPDDNRLNGYATEVSNHVPSNLTKGSRSGVASAIIFGNWKDLVLAQWGAAADVIVKSVRQGYRGTRARHGRDIRRCRRSSGEVVRRDGGRAHRLTLWRPRFRSRGLHAHAETGLPAPVRSWPGRVFYCSPTRARPSAPAHESRPRKGSVNAINGMLSLLTELRGTMPSAPLIGVLLESTHRLGGCGSEVDRIQNMKKVIQKMALAILMVFGAISARADLGWHAVYEVNSSGTVTSGSVAALITAINTGADVKVITYDGTTPQVWIPGFIQISSSGTAVFAHARTISVEARVDGGAQIKSSAYDIDVVLNTNNVVSYVRYAKNGSKADVDSIYNFRQIWLVNY